MALSGLKLEHFSIAVRFNSKSFCLKNLQVKPLLNRPLRLLSPERDVFTKRTFSAVGRASVYVVSYDCVVVCLLKRRKAVCLYFVFVFIFCVYLKEESQSVYILCLCLHSVFVFASVVMCLLFKKRAASLFIVLRTAPFGGECVGITVEIQ